MTRGPSFMRVAGSLGPSLAVMMLGADAHAFHYFEHKWIGDIVCAAVSRQTPGGLACEDTSRADRSPEGLGITFGDLVAMAGDHFATPEELEAALRGENEEKLTEILRARNYQAVGVRGWLGNGGRDALPDLRACQPITSLLGGSPGARPDAVKDSGACIGALAGRLPGLARREWELAASGDCYLDGSGDEAQFIGTPDYLAVAADAKGKHFQPAALFAYRDYSATASAAFAGLNASQKASLFGSRAWTQAAFALHFFTDLFSSGHLRNWTSWNTVREVKRLHDYDCTRGLDVVGRVQGSRSDARFEEILRWRAFGDMCLLGRNATDHRAATVLAAANAFAKMVGAPGLALDDEGQANSIGDFTVPALIEQVSPPGTSPEDYAISLFNEKGCEDCVVSSERNPRAPYPPDLIAMQLEPIGGGGAGVKLGSSWDPRPVGFGGLRLQATPRWGLGTIVPFRLGLEAALGGRDYALGAGFLGVELPIPETLVAVALRVPVGAMRAPGFSSFLFTTGLGLELRWTPPGRWNFGVGTDFRWAGPEGAMVGTLSAFFSTQL